MEACADDGGPLVDLERVAVLVLVLVLVLVGIYACEALVEVVVLVMAPISSVEVVVLVWVLVFGVDAWVSWDVMEFYQLEISETSCPVQLYSYLCRN